MSQQSRVCRFEVESRESKVQSQEESGVGSPESKVMGWESRVQGPRRIHCWGLVYLVNATGRQARCSFDSGDRLPDSARLPRKMLWPRLLSLIFTLGGWEKIEEITQNAFAAEE